jgi:O-acetyl-ADP-ribose deacetylase (regulator of RNase III)/uncharacterized protein YwgA
MSSSSDRRVHLVKGDILKSSAQTLVNTVNCVGIMGKGVALAFKKRYPEMFDDYVQRCTRGEVQLGNPYPYQVGNRLVVNFPTKQHWRSVSKLEDIEKGLEHLKHHLEEWGIHSLAVPPLGCGNGQLDWTIVGPTLVRHLSSFGVPVDLYVPHELSIEAAEAVLPDALIDIADAAPQRVSPGMVALVEVLHRVESEQYHWPIGRIMFQKLAYFSTSAGIPTGLEYTAASYGPYAEGLKRTVAHLQNNGLVTEVLQGRMIITSMGPTFADARREYRAQLDKWESTIKRVADLTVRFTSRQAEIAATVHYAAQTLKERYGRPPTAREVITAVEKWKVRRQPPVERDDIARSIVNLATQGWIKVEPDESIKHPVEELIPF